MSKWTKKGRAPAGYEYIQPVMDALERELREKMNEPHEGKRKCEALWPVHQINWQRSRYVYDLFYKYKRISREVYDYCVRMKLVDANLIAKWKKPGYERLCSTFAINTKNYNYGTVSICRVPKHQLSDDQVIQEKHAGCRGCASGPGGYHNIFGNKYGQYLARIQIAREKHAQEARGGSDGNQVWATQEEEQKYDNNSDDEEDDEEEKEVKGTAKKESGRSAANKRKLDEEEEQKGNESSDSEESEGDDESEEDSDEPQAAKKQKK